MKKITIVLLAYSLVVCASGYSQFYTAVLGATPETIAAMRTASQPATPVIEHSPTMPDPGKES